MRTIRKGRQPSANDTYFALVRRYPLRPIRADAEHAAALRFLTATSMRYQGTNDRGTLDYLETLAKLIEDYEQTAGHGPDLSDLSPRSALNHIMEAHGLNVSQMAAVLGTSQGTLSDIRNGTRRSGLSKQMIRRLVDRFGVDARLFL